MGNKRAREFRKQEDLRESKRKAREVARAVHVDVGWQGAGERVLQLVHAPAFDTGLAWDIRKLEDEFAVYRSSVESGWGERRFR